MFSQLFYERNVKWATIVVSEANYSTFFLIYVHFEREREREIKCVCVHYLYLFVSPYKQRNYALLQKPSSAEKYNVAIQYGNYFIKIKVGGWDIFPPPPNVQDMVTALVYINYIVY